jgi:hypothetical protein
MIESGVATEMLKAAAAAAGEEFVPTGPSDGPRRDAGTTTKLRKKGEAGAEAEAEAEGDLAERAGAIAAKLGDAVSEAATGLAGVAAEAAAELADVAGDIVDDLTETATEAVDGLESSVDEGESDAIQDLSAAGDEE